MNTLPLVGFAALGLFVGLLVGWCVNSEREPDGKTYGSLIGIGAGAAAGFVPFFSTIAGHEVWVYPVTLLAGLLVAPFADVFYMKFYTFPHVYNVFKDYNEKYGDPKNQRKKQLDPAVHR